MSFKTGNPKINNFDFLKRFGTLYDLLISSFNEEISTFKAAKEQNEMIKKINKLGSFVLLEEEIIKEEKTKSATKKTKTKT